MQVPKPLIMIELQRVIDRYVGTLLCLGLGLFRRRSEPPKKPSKILVIKLWAMGESILTLPMLTILRKNYPNTQIDVLVRNRNKKVYEGAQYINKIISLDETNALRLILL